MGNNHFEKNTAALAANHLVNEEALRACETKDSSVRIEIEPAKRQGFTGRVSHPAKGSWSLCSAIDPVEEAARWTKQNIDHSKACCFLFGFGLGHHARHLQRKAKKDFARVMVFEQISPQLCEVLRRIDFSDLFSGTDIFFVFYKDLEELTCQLLVLLNDDIARNLSIASFAPALKIHEEEYAQALRFIAERIHSIKIAIRSKTAIGRHWHIQILSNLPYMADSLSIAPLKDAFKDVPMFVVGAGPSLKKNIRELKKAQNHGVIYAAGTALKPLLEEGITPHFVGSCDANPAISKQLEGVDTSGFYLVCDMVTAPLFLERFSPRQRLFYGSDSHAWDFVQRRLGIENYPVIFTGSNVASLGNSFGVYCGCNPVVMVGQDLALAQDNKLYAEKSIKEEYINPSNEIYEVEGETEPFVRTIPIFKDDLFIKENFFALMPNVKFINATEGGAKHKHTTSMKLSEAVESFCVNPLYASLKIAELLKNERPAVQPKILRSTIDEMIVQIERIAAPLSEFSSMAAEGFSCRDPKTKMLKLRAHLDELKPVLADFSNFFDLYVADIDYFGKTQAENEEQNIAQLWAAVQDSLAALRHARQTLCSSLNQD